MTVVDEQLKTPESSPLRVGEVQVVTQEIAHDRKGHEYTLRRLKVGDESDLNPHLRDIFREEGNQLEQALRHNPHWGSTEIKEGVVSVATDNKAAHWLYYNPDGTPTQLLDWAAKFPTAIALEPLQRLEQGGHWLPGGGPDDRSLELYTYMSDAIGLRSRARIYSKRLVEIAEETHVSDMNIISLGSGASVPNIQATQALEKDNRSVHWKFFDFDPEALKFAQKLVDEKGFDYSTFDYGPEWINPKTGVVEPKGQNYLRAFGEQDESADVVDALGLWEYLKPNEAIRFAQTLIKKVKPGGSLIVSNMLPSRPQRELNQRAVGWPGLYLRSDTDLLDIVKAAGIDTKQVTMSHAEDGVYVVMEIKKQ
jgi:hypothetical protein